MGDYVFITFILGNDFIPHSPSINIRTNGIDILLDIYRNNFSYNDPIIKNNKIQWKQMKKLFEILSNSEKDYLINEHIKREKLENRYYLNNTIEEKEFKLNSLPVLHRDGEKYINPDNDFWQKRYYSILFNCNNDEKRIQKICLNYLEALEWTYKYYTNDCFDWRWKYNYEYAPLFQDLTKFTAFYDMSYINFSE